MDRFTKAQAAEGLTAWLRRNEPEFLMTECERYFRSEGWDLIYTPPCCPSFQVAVSPFAPPPFPPPARGP